MNEYPSILHIRFEELLLDAWPDQRLGLKERKLCKHGHRRLVDWNKAGEHLTLSIQLRHAKAVVPVDINRKASIDGMKFSCMVFAGKIVFKNIPRKDIGQKEFENIHRWLLNRGEPHTGNMGFAIAPGMTQGRDGLGRAPSPVFSVLF